MAEQGFDLGTSWVATRALITSMRRELSTLAFGVFMFQIQKGCKIVKVIMLLKKIR